MIPSEVVSLIGSLGFPIVAFFLMFQQLQKKDESFQKVLSELTKAVENNTLVLKEVCGKLEN